jgi:crotonobetainyl-CoA:carnitine CoA-transferase CaiB-like acyl-CoA transferase
MTNPANLLTGVRVLDLTKATSGPYATQTLADMGADVLKVEEPPHGPHKRDVLDANYQVDGMDPFFLCVNRNKRSVALKLTHPEGLAAFHDLVRTADIVVDNYRPGVTSKLKVDHDTLAAINPRIVTCALSGFGATGPLTHRAAFDITIQGQTGMTDFVGLRDPAGRLEASNAAIADLLGGIYISVAASAALHRVAATGEGCHIDVGMYDSVLTWFAGFGVQVLNFGVPTDISRRVLWGNFNCKDRPLVIAAHRASPYERFCRAIEREDLLTDPRFATPVQRFEHVDEIKAIIDSVLVTRTADEWIERFEAHGVSYGETLTMEEALASPHTAAREMVVEVAAADGAPLKLIGNPIKVGGVQQHYQAPPRLGQHTSEVLIELAGRSRDQIADLHEAGAIYASEREQDVDDG